MALYTVCMMSLPEVADTAVATVVKVVSAVGVAVGGYKMFMEGLRLINFLDDEPDVIDPENLAVGLGLFAIGCAGWWVADKIADMGSPHMQRAEASRLRGMQSQLAR